MLQKQYPYYLANKPVQANIDLAVTDKYTGEVATHVALADEQVIDQAIAAAVSAAKPFKNMPAYARQDILQHCGQKNSPWPSVLKRANQLKIAEEKSAD